MSGAGATEPRSIAAERFVAAVRERGSDATTVRDAAHEAHHALDAGLSDLWEREAIHEALCEKRSGAHLWLAEIEARVIEQLVCEALGADPGGSLDHWLCVSAMEAIKYRLPFAGHAISLRYAERMRSDAKVLAAYEAVLALGAAS